MEATEPVAEPQPATSSQPRVPTGTTLPTGGAVIVAAIGAALLLSTISAWMWQGLAASPSVHVIRKTTTTAGKGSTGGAVTVDERTTRTSRISDTALVSLITAGAVLLLGGVFSNELVRLRFLGAELEFREVSRRVVVALRERTPDDTSAEQFGKAYDVALSSLFGPRRWARRRRSPLSSHELNWRPSDDVIERAVNQALDEHD